MADADAVKTEVQEQVQAGGFLAALAERVGASVRASAVFGQPVERGDVTVIPVARAAWGFGGGSGVEDGKEGSGGGGGGSVTPIGYIEVDSAGAEFRPIRDPRVVLIAVTAGIAVAGLVSRAILRR